ncbi:hypothetical protein BJ322DRAFT_1062597 [Thelephora terrestris]|uniref:DUF6535 domain-containing protein n=1 Tax=Thelephora terrestris TaxID=56493 RepID=A0A9P6HFW7_9AGAM|nr:hypothetical protein BJ322DRAFT_1062597 [Thelephora terrestris]
MEEPAMNQKATIDPKALERAVQNVLDNYFPRLESNDDARAEFYKKFKCEAEKYDKDLSERCSSDLDTASLFAGLFSAVTSAFIVAVETKLEPDYTQLSYKVLTVIADANLGTITPGQHPTLPQWTGPDPTLVRVQSILFSSLAASLLSAFVALLGKQWLNRYFQVDMRGAPIDRNRAQRRKREGMTTWRFKLVTESLPLMLQASLLLLSWALSVYLFTVNSLVA